MFFYVHFSTNKGKCGFLRSSKAVCCLLENSNEIFSNAPAYFLKTGGKATTKPRLLHIVTPFVCIFWKNYIRK